MFTPLRLGSDDGVTLHHRSFYSVPPTPGWVEVHRVADSRLAGEHLIGVRRRVQVVEKCLDVQLLLSEREAKRGHIDHEIHGHGILPADPVKKGIRSSLHNVESFGVTVALAHHMGETQRQAIGGRLISRLSIADRDPRKGLGNRVDRNGLGICEHGM